MYNKKCIYIVFFFMINLILLQIFTNNVLAKEEKNFTWKIEIPVINVSAQIYSGTSKDILNKYVGHFEETSLLNGNIGLAAHNRGYAVNYFGNIKDLNIGDEIIYKIKNTEKIYKVNVKTIITDENWKYLENTDINTITLITCVENMPGFRRCIQAIELNKREYMLRERKIYEKNFENIFNNINNSKFRNNTICKQSNIPNKFSGFIFQR